MKKNMGPADTVIRTLIALVVLILHSKHMISGKLEIVLLVLAGILLLTSFTGVSPLYKLLNFDTRKSAGPAVPGIFTTLKNNR